MKSSDLFSHRNEPEVVDHAGRDSESVPLPTFSDRPKSDSAATGRIRSDGGHDQGR
jgi:hypothetical protein